MENNVGQFT